MKNITTKSISGACSLSETIWTEQDRVYKVQYKHLNNSHSEILRYHFANYPDAKADIFEFLQNDEYGYVDMCYTYFTEDKDSISSISRIYFLENTLHTEMPIKEEALNIQTLATGGFTKYAYKKDQMSYLFEYVSNGELLHIISFFDSEDPMDFENPLDTVDWSQVSFPENPKKYYANGLN